MSSFFRLSQRLHVCRPPQVNAKFETIREYGEVSIGQRYDAFSVLVVWLRFPGHISPSLRTISKCRLPCSNLKIGLQDSFWVKSWNGKIRSDVGIPNQFRKKIIMKHPRSPRVYLSSFKWAEKEIQSNCSQTPSCIEQAKSRAIKKCIIISSLMIL